MSQDPKNIIFIKYFLSAVQMFFLMVFSLFGVFLHTKQIKIEIWVAALYNFYVSLSLGSLEFLLELSFTLELF